MFWYSINVRIRTCEYNNILKLLKLHYNQRISYGLMSTCFKILTNFYNVILRLLLDRLRLRDYQKGYESSGTHYTIERSCRGQGKMATNLFGKVVLMVKTHKKIKTRLTIQSNGCHVTYSKLHFLYFYSKCCL